MIVYLNYDSLFGIITFIVYDMNKVGLASAVRTYELEQDQTIGM